MPKSCDTIWDFWAAKNKGFSLRVSVVRAQMNLQSMNELGSDLNDVHLLVNY